MAQLNIGGHLVYDSARDSAMNTVRTWDYDAQNFGYSIYSIGRVHAVQVGGGETNPVIQFTVQIYFKVNGDAGTSSDFRYLNLSPIYEQWCSQFGYKFYASQGTVVPLLSCPTSFDRHYGAYARLNFDANLITFGRFYTTSMTQGDFPSNIPAGIYTFQCHISFIKA